MTGTIAMENPWLELPEVPDYILPQDRAQMDAHGESPQRLGLNLQLLPVPWNGALGSASVVLLTLNPSVRDNAVSEEPDADFRKAILANLQFGNDPPFFSLDRRFRNKGGYAYWLRLLNALVTRFGVDRISHRIMCIQYFPYRSATYVRPRCVAPSQHFSWALASQAVREGKLVVVQRSWDLWVGAVPELSDYPCIRLNNIRSPFLSEGNMPAVDWTRLVRALSS